MSVLSRNIDRIMNALSRNSTVNCLVTITENHAYCKLHSTEINISARVSYLQHAPRILKE